MMRKERFSDDPERYTSFLKVFSEIYGVDAPDRSYEDRIALIQDEMKTKIFENYPDLFEGFQAFVPATNPADTEHAGSG
jgi:hypothetical protein